MKASVPFVWIRVMQNSRSDMLLHWLQLHYDLLLGSTKFFVQLAIESLDLGILARFLHEARNASCDCPN